ncbi:PD-(D/E)XK nuclease family protein [Ruminobacter sp. RM87]|uniref:PDDEXK-like family protein n=1 Tax=Ruminobacter sp. RM87 TaxID=1200567 RepID=UPI0004E0D57A|nr:PD-(D/E)XK nuclease family protein [Ruminobacter sp. RM87]
MENQKVDDNTYHSLLRNIGVILNIKKYAQTLNQSPEDSFTVFSALGIEEKELPHCRIIYELLNSHAQHGLSKKFLHLFFKIVLNKKFENNAVVTRELYFNESSKCSGRIDLFIETPGFCYPIEVKINADDQETQLYRYHEYASHQGKEFKVFYLTLNGRPPKAKSIKGMDEKKLNNVQYISFDKHILRWLKVCADIAYKEQKLSIYGAIRQYITLIEKLTVQQYENQKQENIFMNSITDIMSLSSEYFLAAKAVADNFKHVQSAKIKNIFDRIKEHIHNEFHLNGEYCDKEINNFCSGKISYPRLKFKFSPRKDINLTLVFEIENDDEDTFYYGVFPEFNNESDDNEIREMIQKRKQELKNAFDNVEWKNIVEQMQEENLWLWWKNLPSKDEQPNFINHNEHYLKLYNPAEYEEVMNKIFSILDQDIPSILETGLPKSGMITY